MTELIARNARKEQKEEKFENDCNGRDSSRIDDGDNKKLCRVCGDKALSVNFNVVTCESCKAFFRRNALKPKAFRCPFSGSCEINAVSRKFCKKCRLRKCFDVGMMKEWIMSDEARLKKRELINTNRERRRTVIMATVAKHGIDTGHSEQADERNVETTKTDGFVSHQIISSRPSQEETCYNDNIHEPHDDQLITIRKSALIELVLQCQSHQCDDLNVVINAFLERYAVSTSHCGFNEIQSQKNECVNGKNIISSSTCDCRMCADYQTKYSTTDRSLMNMGVHPTGVQLPTLRANANEEKPPNMLSFLAPSMGKHYHSVDYPLTMESQYSSQSHQQQLVHQVGPTSWTESATSMPTIPLEIPPNVFEIVNRSAPMQQSQTLLCPLPVKLMTASNEAKLDSMESIESRRRRKNEGGVSTLSLFQNPNSGNFPEDTLAVMPYALMAKLQELITAKTIITENGTRHTVAMDGYAKNALKENDVSKDDGYFTLAFSQQILNFQRLPESDKMNLLTVMLSKLPDEKVMGIPIDDKNFEKMGLCEKYVRIIPKVWREDERMMLILMALALFDSSQCHVLCKSIIEEQQSVYVDLLRKYLECIYKSCEVQSAHDILLAILCDIRRQK